MSQASQSRVRFNGWGRSGRRDGGRSSQRHETAQATRVPLKSSDGDENYMFDIQPIWLSLSRHRESMSQLGIRTSERFFVGRYEVVHIYPERQNQARRRVTMTMRETTAKKRVPPQQEARLRRAMEALLPALQNSKECWTTRTCANVRIRRSYGSI